MLFWSFVTLLQYNFGAICFLLHYPGKFSHRVRVIVMKLEWDAIFCSYLSFFFKSGKLSSKLVPIVDGKSSIFLFLRLTQKHKTCYSDKIWAITSVFK